jgi:hypothetical protein
MEPATHRRVHSEVAQYDEFAAKAVDEYTNDRRVIGNSLLAQARRHSLLVDQLLASIVADLTGEAIRAREQVVAEGAAATRLSQIVMAAAVLVGGLLTLLVLRSIIVPLRWLPRWTADSGNVDVPIPAWVGRGRGRGANLADFATPSRQSWRERAARGSRS